MTVFDLKDRFPAAHDRIERKGRGEEIEIHLICIDAAVKGNAYFVAVCSESSSAVFHDGARPVSLAGHNGV